jgi:hypothetical protein
MLLTTLALAALHGTAPASTDFLVERITTRPPFPRGLQIVDGELYVLCRGRVREYGGVSATVEDEAGTLYVVDLSIAEPFAPGEPSPAVRDNGRVVALPTAPPFKLWDRSASPPTRDRETDRPYCGLTYHPGTQSFYLCAFSGVDKPEGEGSTFSKNLTDAILRYDMRTEKWYEVERHDIEKGGLYPHHDPARSAPPHGWLNGPDNCLAVGDWLYAVSKDNSLLVRYDLRALAADPEAGAPQSEVCSPRTSSCRRASACGSRATARSATTTAGCTSPRARARTSCASASTTRSCRCSPCRSSSSPGTTRTTRRRRSRPT